MSSIAGEADAVRFREQVAPILKARCLRCHQGKDAKGDVDLSKASGVIDGQGDGWVVVPGKPGESRLLEVISGAKPTMPKSGDRLNAGQVETIRSWIAEGASWRDGEVLKADPNDWWSLRPIVRPAVPDPGPEGARWVRTPIDAFVYAALKAKGLSPSPEADRRTLIRRVSFDLTGLPPTPEEVEAFLADPAPDAYERLVDRLLASPRYGERWGRHWLDVARYGDTHGYDKDKPRPNAWPYRDYVIRAFNEDKPYGRFVREQVAGDVLFPGTRDGVEALGFISAGPWDFIGHAEVPESKLDGQIARLLDRDDMVANTMNTFVSMTVQCARCHDHKFDPVTQEDYYSLHAVFAALDRADRPYDLDPEVGRPTKARTGLETLGLERRDRGVSQAREGQGRRIAGEPGAPGSPRSRPPARLAPRGRRLMATTAASRRRPRRPAGSRSTSVEVPRSRGWCSMPATTTSTRSAPASASRPGSRSRLRMTPVSSGE